MPWVRLDDRFPEHPKVAGLSGNAIALFVAGLCYCNRMLTDGFIPNEVVAILRPNCHGNATRIAMKSLVSSGLIETVSGGYSIHDYLDYQASKAQVDSKREVNRNRQQRFRNAVTGPLVTQFVTPAPIPIPNTSHPNPKKEREGDGAIAPPPQRKKTVKPKPEPITQDFIEAMVEEFAPQLGGTDRTRRKIEDALNHKAMDKAKDKRQRLKSWLTEDAERYTGGQNGRQLNGVARTTGGQPAYTHPVTGVVYHPGDREYVDPITAEILAHHRERKARLERDRLSQPQPAGDAGRGSSPGGPGVPAGVSQPGLPILPESRA